MITVKELIGKLKNASRKAAEYVTGEGWKERLPKLILKLLAYAALAVIIILIIYWIGRLIIWARYTLFAAGAFIVGLIALNAYLKNRPAAEQPVDPIDREKMLSRYSILREGIYFIMREIAAPLRLVQPIDLSAIECSEKFIKRDGFTVFRFKAKKAAETVDVAQIKKALQDRIRQKLASFEMSTPSGVFWISYRGDDYPAIWVVEVIVIPGTGEIVIEIVLTSTE